MCIIESVTYSSAAEFQQDVDVVFVVEEAVKSDHVVVSQAAVNTNLLR